MDTVFDIGNRAHARYYLAKLPWYIKKNVLRQDVPPFPPLYQINTGEEEHYDNDAKPYEHTTEDMPKDTQKVVPTPP